MNLPTEERDCPICGNEKLTIQEYNNYQYSFLKKLNRNIFIDCSLLSCYQCGFSYTFPFIELKKIEEFYSTDYRGYGSPHYEFLEIGKYRWKKHLNSRSMSQIMLAAQYIDFSTVKNFLDIGCGKGKSFSTLRKTDYNPRFYTIESGEYFSHRLHTLNVDVIEPSDQFLRIDDEYKNFLM